MNKACQICESTFKNYGGLSAHIRQKHHDISIQNYYDKFLAKNLKEKTCSICEKINSFKSLSKGYNNFCSRQCAHKDSNVNKNRGLGKSESFLRKNRFAQIKLTNKQWLIEQYESKNQTEIAEILGVSKSFVTKWMKLYNIKQEKLTHLKSKNYKGYKKLLNSTWLIGQYENYSCEKIASNIGVSHTTVARKLKEYGVSLNGKTFSSQETEICDYLNQIGVNIKERGSKKIISPFELDIYLPDFNLAIEFNGIYWHTEQNGKDRNYHLNKTRMCEGKGIQLLHIFENEWNEKQDIWKSIIRNKLGKNPDKIFARKCFVKEIDSKTSNQFLNENHLQGKDRASIRIGLFYEDVLVSLFTIGKSRYNKKYQYELLRFCNKLNTSVIGGFSKLLKYFERNYQPTSLITYADKRYSDGGLYEKFFGYIHDSKPNYFYKVGQQLHSRMQYQKHKLSDKLNIFDESLTEYQNMLLNGYDRIWDCGNKVFHRECGGSRWLKA